MSSKSNIPGAMRRRVLKASSFTCIGCGLQGFEKRFPKGGYGHYTPIDGIYLCVSRIVPKAKGGTSDYQNLRVLCTSCLKNKSAIGGVDHA